MTWLRGLRRLLPGVALGLGLGLAVLVVAPAVVGWRTLTVMSGSMAPAIDTGDAVVTRPVPPATLRPGDVTTFRDPEGAERLITHRVLAVSVSGSSVEVVTRGDANTGTERWQVATGGRVGRVVYRVPHVGFLLVPAATPLGRLGLLALPLSLLGLVTLVEIWRRKPESDDAGP